MKATPQARHPSTMRDSPTTAPASPLAWVGVGMLALAAAAPGCVLAEQLDQNWSEDTTIGGNDASVPSGSDPAGPPLPGSDTAGGPGREDFDSSSTGFSGSEGETGRPEDVPDPDDTSTSTGPTIFGEDCCLPGEASGCFDPVVEACVCDLDPYCCQGAWDEVCVDLMEDAGCLSCDGVNTQLVPDNCCVANDGPGCMDDAKRDCVCAADPFCCDVLWDDTCVGLVDELGCGTCLPPTCCEPSPQPGCAADPMIESCVCGTDAFCCDQAWDNLCVDYVQDLGCGDCTVVSPGDTGSGGLDTGGSEDGATTSYGSSGTG